MRALYFLPLAPWKQAGPYPAGRARLGPCPARPARPAGLAGPAGPARPARPGPDGPLLTRIRGVGPVLEAGIGLSMKNCARAPQFQKC